MGATQKELTSTELALINFTIYYHPDHVEYYRMFACGEYTACWNYLMKHRDQLVLANVPEERKSLAEHSIKSAKAMNLGKKDDNE